jgi:hypothetical protein
LNQGELESVPPARSTTHRLRTLIVGKAKDPLAPGVFHKVSLVAFMAWIGLGADGLSSSAYGPDEAFRALGAHSYMAVGLAFATAFYRLHHLLYLLTNYRALPVRRGRLRGGDQAAWR